MRSARLRPRHRLHDTQQHQPACVQPYPCMQYNINSARSDPSIGLHSLYRTRSDKPITFSTEPEHASENHLNMDGTPNHRFKEVRRQYPLRLALADNRSTAVAPTVIRADERPALRRSETVPRALRLRAPARTPTRTSLALTTARYYHCTKRTVRALVGTPTVIWAELITLTATRKEYTWRLISCETSP